MDAERFGRALGIGVRVTGKALKSAVDAAAAPNPRPYQAPAVKPSAGQPDRSVSRSVARSAAQTITQSKTTAAGIRRGGKRFGEAVWEPAARAGGVLWFEVTGSFFALFAPGRGLRSLAPAHGLLRVRLCTRTTRQSLVRPGHVRDFCLVHRFELPQGKAPRPPLKATTGRGTGSRSNRQRDRQNLRPAGHPGRSKARRAH